MAKPISNHHLQAVLDQAGYARARAAFARQVNLRGHDRGLKLRYDAASVYWWLRGRRPDDPVPQVIAEVLARRIGREIAIDELGFAVGGATTSLGLTFADLECARTTVADLWRQQVTGQESSSSMPFIASATTEAGWRWHFDPRDADASHRGRRRVTRTDVDRLRAYQQQSLDLDRRHGGGQFHAPLAAWLHRQVEPMLHGTYTDRVGRQLFAAVAELTGQVAFMSYDIGDHGLAQRHFIQALRLAKAADQTAFGAHILANMSTQAVYLQQPAEAVRLARAAVDGGNGRAHISVMARLHTAEACAHAIAGDARSCITALRLAEDATAKTGESEGPAWAGYFTPAHLAGTAMRCLRDLGRTKEALGYAEQALNLPEGSVRTRALHTALIASVYAAGVTAEPQHASQLGHDALDLAGRVRSRRVIDRIADLAHRLSAHRGDPAVDSFLRRARAYCSTAGQG